ncbi:pilus assembly protein [Massilia violaceinigra]|uniref:Pilus assembly protein n=1 Tax=Massilia violaceinigra TaxID=2045208 RepID=A0ABY4A7K7_9BURK|nr:type 4 pilus major pilin [Massilia violaceinigra]UOD29654.1 pilus assembly protein [Massilia violaceinigra]
MKQIRYPRRQCGASLLEAIAYLGIAAIVILGAVSLLTGAFSSAQSNQAGEEVTAIRTAVRKLYMGQGYGTVAINETLKKAGAFPGTLAVAADGTATNVWGGNVVVTGATGTFTIAYPGLPQDVCVATLVAASGWQKISAPGAAAITTFPVTPAAAATACSVTAAGGNALTFTSN